MTPTEDPVVSMREEITVRIRKPLGIVIEEVDANEPTKGVCVGQMNEGSNAAICRDICIHDKIVAVNDQACSTKSFDDVMDMISSSSGHDIELTVSRTDDVVAIRWPNGVCVATPVGEYLGNSAIDAQYAIPYSCRSGSCGSCEHIARLDNGKEKRFRPCSHRVPKGIESIEFYSQY